MTNKTKKGKKGNLRGTNNSTSKALVALTSALAISKSKPKAKPKSSMTVVQAPLTTGTMNRGVAPVARQISNGLSVSGKEYCGIVNGFGSGSFVLGLIQPLNPTYFVTSVLSNHSRTYLRYKWKRLRFTFITQSSTGTAGQVSLTFNHDVTMPSMNGQSTNFLNRILTSRNSVTGPVWQNLYMDVDMTGSAYGLVDCYTSSDINENIFGEFQAYSLIGTTGNPGYIVMDYEIEFKDAAYQLHSTIVLPSVSFAQATLADASATPTANDAVQWTGGGITNNFASDSIVKIFIVLTRTTFGTSRTAANAYKSNSTWLSTTTVASSALNTFTLVDGAVVYGVINGGSIYVYTNIDSAISGNGSGQIFYNTTGGTADSIYTFAYPVRYPDNLMIVQQ